MAKHASKTVVSKKRRPGSTKAKAVEPKVISKKPATPKTYPAKAAAKESVAAPAARPKLPNVFQLLKAALRMLARNWKLFGGILLVYVVLNLLFVQTLAGMDVSSVKASLDQLFQGHNGRLTAATALSSYVLGASGSTSSDGAVYELMFLLIISLALIRALRELYDNRTPRIRDAFYEGMFPLVPFVLVLLVVAVELIPMTVGATLYATVLNGGIAIYLFEKIIWTIVFAAFCFVTLYLVASSLIALYIATQPGMTPVRALRAANKVTHGRRLKVLGRLLFLPVAIIVGAGIIMIPTILALPAAASVIVFLLTVVGIGIIHSYLFALLRSVLA